MTPDAATLPAPPRTRRPAPALDLPLVNGGRFVLADQRPERFTLVVFYRGLHCPKCKQQLQELQERRDDLTDRGLKVVTISGDGEDRAKQAWHDWDVPDIPIAYDLDEETMRAWGLYVSGPRKDTEPDRFNEPGLFLVEPDGTLYAALIGSMPFARPRLDDLLDAVDFIVAEDYPARGEA